MLRPPHHIADRWNGLAMQALQASQMDSVGLYRFNKDEMFDHGVIIGMPAPFTPRYEISGIPIDPVLAEMRRTKSPWSTRTLLGGRWQQSHLFRRVSGEFGLRGFAALPLFNGPSLAGVLYLGALSKHNSARLTHEGLCTMTSYAAQIATTMRDLPRVHPHLSPRQNDVAHLASEGLSNQEIAEAFGTGLAAVRKHLKALNVIFGTTNRTAMAARWHRETQQA